MTDSPYDSAAPVIERLIAALCDAPNAVELSANVAPGAVSWCFSTDVNDMPKVLGQYHAHLRRIRLIVQCMGAAAGEKWTLSPLVATGTKLAKQREDAPTPERHDPAKDLTLLNEVLACLAIAAYTEASGSPATGFLFTVEPSARQDDETLREVHAALYANANSRDMEPVQLIDAIKRVFRPIGRRQGCRYSVELAEKPAPVL